MVVTLEGGSAIAALLLGAAGSAHCFLMCGPLACAAVGPAEPAEAERPIPLAVESRREARHARLRAAIAWQTGRVLGYATTGALFGLGGRALSKLFARSVTPALPWVLAAALVAGAFLPKAWLAKVPRLPGAAQLLRILGWVRARVARTPRAALFGALTPLLPCGLLYGLFAAEIATGTALAGALLGAAYAVGAIPALAAAQLQARWLVGRPGWTRRLVPVLAALVLVYRAATAARGHSCH